ncbi:MAG: hypothetical protein ACE5G0_03685 [Rhodothermales bacterium]
MPLIHTPSAGAMIVWRAAQVVVLAITVVLIVGFFVQPDLALSVLWNILIPILPATFMITPVLWRGICPLATLNILPNGLLGRRALTSGALPSVGALGIVLLVVLVPARRVLFNEHGVILAVVVIAVAVAAFALGTAFDLKAGFCNAFCPVLPVEKLYGQHPLLELNNPRCGQCTLCTPKGCLDLAPSKSALQATGSAHQSHAWLRSVYGVFAAAFPGFIVGYFNTADGALSTTGTVYLTVGLWAAGSYLLTLLLVLVLKIQAARMLAVLATAAVGLYYWFAAPQIAETLGVADIGALIIRGAALALVSVWLWRAWPRTRRASNGAASGHTTAGPLPSIQQPQPATEE